MADRHPSRRHLVAGILGGLALPGLSNLAGAQAPLAPTPACGDDHGPTPAQTEGPYFTPNSPERASLREPGLAGAPLVFTGAVLTRDCRPVARALVDLWHCDGDGRYDNAGYLGRGHQFTDARGRFRFETVRPGRYPGRTPHFHVKVQAPRGRVLTTQFYFPGEPGNARDGIFRPELLMRLQGGTARYDVVLA